MICYLKFHLCWKDLEPKRLRKNNLEDGGKLDVVSLDSDLEEEAEDVEQCSAVKSVKGSSKSMSKGLSNKGLEYLLLAVVLKDVL